MVDSSVSSASSYGEISMIESGYFIERGNPLAQTKLIMKVVINVTGKMNMEEIWCSGRKSCRNMSVLCAGRGAGLAFCSFPALK